MRDMTKALEQNRIQVHDMRHHMIILREYALKKSMKRSKPIWISYWKAM